MKNFIHLFIFLLFLHSCCSRNILIVTDIGTDVDDAEAICLSCLDPSVKIVGIACTASEPEQRMQKTQNLLHLLDRSDISVGCDASFIDSVLQNTQGKCDVLLIAQATSLSEALLLNSELTKKIRRIYFQGQVFVDSNAHLSPNPQAFNVSEDIAAAESLLSFQDCIPFTIVGKYAAYPLVISRQTFDSYEKSGHPAGAMLKQMALESIDKFAHNFPDRFRKVYGVSEEMTIEDAVATLQHISNPYDAVTYLAIVNPECFNPVKSGKNRLIGLSEDDSGIISKNYNNLQHRIESLFLSLRPEKSY